MPWSSWGHFPSDPGMPISTERTSMTWNNKDKVIGYKVRCMSLNPKPSLKVWGKLINLYLSLIFSSVYDDDNIYLEWLF